MADEHIEFFECPFVEKQRQSFPRSELAFFMLLFEPFFSAAEKGLSFPLLSDTGGALSRLCGLLYAMTPAQLAYCGGRRGIDVAARSAGVGWAVPVPATYVVARDGTVTFAFTDPDWARRAEPAELATAAGRLAGDGEG